MDCVGCETIWETSRTSKEKFCFWNLEFSQSHSTFLWLEGEIKIYVIPFVFIFVLNYQVLNRNDQCDIVSFSKMWFNFIKSRVRRHSWIIGSVSMQALCLWLQNPGRVPLLFLKKGSWIRGLCFSWGHFLFSFPSDTTSLISWARMFNLARKHGSWVWIPPIPLSSLGDIGTVTKLLWASVVSLKYRWENRVYTCLYIHDD